MIFGVLENFCLVLSLVVLVWGFKRLIKLVHSVNDLIANKTMIIWHIIVYFFIIISNTAEILLVRTLKIYEVSTYCALAINLACTIILALIVN